MLSIRRLDWMTYAAFQNALRLHDDSILLYKNQSFPSAFHLSILAQEEIGKMHIVNDYTWRFGESQASLSEIEDETKREAYKVELAEYEGTMLDATYSHPLKQGYFSQNSTTDSDLWLKTVKGTAKRYQNIWSGFLESKKQNATYVGFERTKRKANVNGGLRHPWQIKERMAAVQITRVNDYLLDFGLGLRYTSYCFENENVSSYLKNKRTLKYLASAWTRSSKPVVKKIMEFESLLKDSIVSDSRHKS
jgi:AbiV family abortive infection protein